MNGKKENNILFWLVVSSKLFVLVTLTAQRLQRFVLGGFGRQASADQKVVRRIYLPLSAERRLGCYCSATRTGEYN